MSVYRLNLKNGCTGAAQNPAIGRKPFPFEVFRLQFIFSLVKKIYEVETKFR